MNDSGIPKLEPPQVAVILTESETGIVLTRDGARSIEKHIPYTIWGTLKEARAFAIASSLAKSIEFNVYDSDGKFVGILPRA